MTTGENRSRPWLLVNLGFTPHGGQDLANFHLAHELATRSVDLTLVAFDVSAQLRRFPTVKVVDVARPLRSNLLGERLLALLGRRTFEAHPRRDELWFVGNSGSCPSAEIAWVHYVHHAWAPRLAQGAPRVRNIVSRARAGNARARERRAFERARLVVTNSNRTSADVQELGISSQKIRRVYFGATRPPEDNEVALGDERTLLFLGALGWDSRKGLDTLIEAFAVLCRDPGFRHRLVIAGNGVREPWARLASVLGVEGRVDFVGFSHSPEALIRRADLVLSPVRYEPYGLALQEAICAGVPILVSRDAGFVERMDTASEIMTVPSDASVVEWVERVASALQNLELLRAKARRLASRLLERSWTDFAREFIEVVESAQR